MIDLVLDASVLLKWFVARPEPGHEEAAALRSDYERGAIAVVVPPLIFLEVLNVAGRRWRWSAEALGDLATALGDIGFDIREPDLVSIAAWMARGLTAYDATYVALAEEIGSELVSDDAEILSIACRIARPLNGEG